MALDLGGGSYKLPARRRSVNSRTAGYGYGGHGVNYNEYTQLKRATGSYDPARSSGGSGGSSGGSRRRSGGGGGGGYYSYGGGGGGGGGYNAAAEEEKRKAKARALVEQYYKQGLGSLRSSTNAARPALAQARHNAIQQIQKLYHQNNAVTGATSKDIKGIQANILAGLARQQASLGRDLGNQGADTAALSSAGADYQGDARATGAAQDMFNQRLGQVMATGYTDQRSGLEQTNQSALGSLQANYAQALQALQNARIQSLMGLV